MKKKSKVFAIIMAMMMLMGSVSFSYATQESSDNNAGNSVSNEQNVNNGSAKSDNNDTGVNGTEKQGTNSDENNQSAQESEGTSDQSNGTDSDTNLSSLDSDSEDNAEATAYAVFDSSTGTLTFKKGSDIPEATDTTKVFTGVEDTSKSIPWEGIKDDIVKVVFEDAISPKTTCDWFWNAEKLKTVENLKKLGLSECTDMSYMFGNCESLISIDLSGIDASKVTKVNSMFQSCTSLKSVNMKGLDISSATSMYYMFYECLSLETIDFSEAKASSVKDIDGILRDCRMLTSAIMPSCSPTSMDYIFENCWYLSKVDLSGLDCSGASSYQSAFNSASIKEAKLGVKFSFGNSKFSSYGTWHKEGSNKQYTASELAKEYDGSTMAGTYIFDTDCKYYAGKYNPFNVNGKAQKNILDAKTSQPLAYAYCINHYINFYPEFCNGYNVSNNDELIAWLDTDSKRDSSKDAFEGIATVLYYGLGNVHATLPGTNETLQEACGIDDSDALGITQFAVWYYSDGYESYNYYNSLGDGRAKYYAALTGRSSEYNLTYDSIPDADKLKVEVLSVDGKVGNYQNLIMLTSTINTTTNSDGNITNDSNNDNNDSSKDSTNGTIKTNNDSNGTNDSNNSSDNDKSSKASAKDKSSSSDSAANTGDNTNITLLFALMAIALAGIVVTVVITVKKRKYNS